MRVTTISARIKASKEVNGCWKTIEFGAEGILDSGDEWKKSQDQLFADLTGQLKKAFGPNDKKPDYPESPIPKGRKTGNNKKNSKPNSKMCSIHGVKMKLFTNAQGGSWYSHNDETTGGEWCSGKKNRGKKK